MADEQVVDGASGVDTSSSEVSVDNSTSVDTSGSQDNYEFPEGVNADEVTGANSGNTETQEYVINDDTKSFLTKRNMDVNNLTKSYTELESKFTPLSQQVSSLTSERENLNTELNNLRQELSAAQAAPKTAPIDDIDNFINSYNEDPEKAISDLQALKQSRDAQRAIDEALKPHLKTIEEFKNNSDSAAGNNLVEANYNELSQEKAFQKLPGKLTLDSLLKDESIAPAIDALADLAGTDPANKVKTLLLNKDLARVFAMTARQKYINPTLYFKQGMDYQKKMFEKKQNELNMPKSGQSTTSKQGSSNGPSKESKSAKVLAEVFGNSSLLGPQE